MELVSALVRGAKPKTPGYSVCIECKRRQTVCVAVARGVACLGPITQAGCGAICPSYCRECFGCYGPQQAANPASLTGFYQDQGADPAHLVRLMRNFNGYAPEFRAASDALEAGIEE